LDYFVIVFEIFEADRACYGLVQEKIAERNRLQPPCQSNSPLALLSIIHKGLDCQKDDKKHAHIPHEAHNIQAEGQGSDERALILLGDTEATAILDENDTIDSKQCSDSKIPECFRPLTSKVGIVDHQEVEEAQDHPVEREELEHDLDMLPLGLAVQVVQLNLVDVLGNHAVEQRDHKS